MPELILACRCGRVRWVPPCSIAFGSPNRRPAPSVVAARLGAAGLDLRELTLERVEGGRSQLYRATTDNGDAFVKVYAQDSRDADLLYRGLPHAAAPWTERRLALAVARTRRRTRSA